MEGVMIRTSCIPQAQVDWLRIDNRIGAIVLKSKHNHCCQISSCRQDGVEGTQKTIRYLEVDDGRNVHSNKTQGATHESITNASKKSHKTNRPLRRRPKEEDISNAKAEFSEDEEDAKNAKMQSTCDEAQRPRPKLHPIIYQ